MVVACAVLPMNGVMVYDVIGLPPSAGALQNTVAVAFPAVAVTAVGALGGATRAAVVNDQLKAELMTWPDESATPLTVALYDVEFAKGADGVNVIVAPL